MLAAARFAALLFAAISLPAHAASCIWYSHDDSIRQVDTDTNQVTRVVPLRDPHRLVMSAEDCGVWTLDKYDRKVLRFNAEGALERVIDVRQLHPALDEVEHLRLDPRDGTLWVTDNQRIFHISAAGQLLGQFSAPSDIRRVHVALDQTLWVLGRRDLWHFDANGALLSSHTLGQHLAGDARYFEVDSVGGVIWLVDEDDLAQLQIANPTAPPLRIRLQRDITAFTLDPLTGNAWIAQHESLLGFSRTGERIATVYLQALGIRKPEKLAFDPVSRSLWAGAERSVSRFTDAGLLVTRFDARDGDEALGAPAFSVRPTLALVRPPEGALTNNPQPEIRLSYGADCNGQACDFASSHFSGYTLSATLNNQAIGSAFQFDPTAREAFHLPPARLPEGLNSFSAQAKDPFGRLSNTLSSTFTIDSVAPAFLTLSPPDGAAFQVPQAVIQGTVDDPQANVILEGTGLSQSGGSFSFPVALQGGSNLFTLSAIDRAGNRTTVQRTLGFIPLPAMTLSITAPAPNATVSGSTVLVTGTLQGPANTGVTVNGVVAVVIAGTFYATVPVQPGPNTITAVAKTQDGFTSERSVSITSTGPEAMEVSIKSQTGIAPSKVTFQINLSAGTTLQVFAADFDGNGTQDLVSSDVNAPIEFTYTQPGVYSAQFVLVDSLGNFTTPVVRVVVQDAAALDQQLKAIWGGFAGALANKDLTRASQSLSSNARETYLPMLEALKDRLPSIVANFSELRTFSLTSELGEYAVRRTEASGKTYLYLIYLRLGEDGVWRLESM